MPPEHRTDFEVRPNTIRLSAGIDRTEILLEGLANALDKIKIKPELKTTIDAAQKSPKERGGNYANVRI